jgi:hypothetical protein
MPSYARSGGTGGWRAYFSEDDLAFFNKYAGNTLNHLGYMNPSGG